MANPIELARSLAYRILGFSHDGKRDLYASFGYPRILQLDNYVAMYRRNGVASRIIKAFPKATWRDCPNVRDAASDDASTSPFVDAFEMLNEKFKLTRYFERADRLAGLGQYGILLIGLNDNLELDQPITGGKAELLYLTPYSERSITTVKIDENINSARFGLPEFYTVQKKAFLSGGNVSSSKSFRVHYSRVIHIAETLDDDEVFGVPVLESVFNHLMDLEKVVGGGAETFWLNSRQGIAFTADKDATLSEEQVNSMKQQAEDFEHQLRRNIALKGVQANVLNAAVADPKHNVDTLLDLIAGAKGIPKRILIGSERGELASTQDESNWSTQIDERRKNFATSTILKPFCDLMITTGNMPVPAQDDYWVEWPEVATESPKQRADVALAKAQATAAYSNAPGAPMIVALEEFRVWLGEEPISEYQLAPEPPPIDQTNPAVIDQFKKQQTAYKQQQMKQRRMRANKVKA